MIDNISENPSQNNIILIINSIVLIIMPDLLLSSIKVTITSVTQKILAIISTIFKYKSSIFSGIENTQHNIVLNIKVDIHNVVNMSNAMKSFLNPNLTINLINPKIEITENKINFPIILSLSVSNNTIYFFSIYDSIF